MKSTGVGKYLSTLLVVRVCGGPGTVGTFSGYLGIVGG